MSSLTKLLVLFTVALSVSGLATPHVVRSPHGHRALAARMAAPAPSPAVGPYGREVKLVRPRRKRQDTGRCRAAPSTTSSEAQAPTSSTEPVANVASLQTSSTTPPPAETTSTQAPAPTFTPEPSTSSEAPAPSPTADNSNSDNGNSGNSNSGSSEPSFMVGTQTGQGTFYDIGLGACGITNSGNDRIAAVSHLLFDSFPGYNGVNPNNNPICGRTVVANYQGKSTTVQITDRCEGCALTDLDFSPTAFADLADFGLGRISGVTWTWA